MSERVLNLHITNQCNLFCKHCYNGKRNVKFLTAEQVEYIIKNVLEYFKAPIDRINLLGGEPTIHPDFLQILKICQTNAPIVGVSTNGKNIMKYALAFRKEDKIQLSIETLDEKLADWYRGKGYYEHFCKINQQLNEIGIKPSVKMLLDKKVLPYLLPSLLKAVELGFTNLGFNRIVLSGNASDLDSELSSDELMYAYKILLGFMVKYNIRIHVSDGIWYNYIAEKFKLPNNVACAALNSTIAVIENGDVMLCRRLEFCLGNIFEENIASLINKSNDFKRLLARDFIGICGDCPKKINCGGCRACVKAKTGNLLGSDELCFLRGKK